jgi:uncharacterized protein (TIGR02300 family)
LAKAEWGSKRTCFSCGARFYDLRREPIVCPVCNAAHDPARQPRPKRSGPVTREEPVLVAVGDGTAREGIDDELLDDEAADSDIDELDESSDESGDSEIDALSGEEAEIIEDASELGEDDDDIGEVMEHVDDEIEDKA